LISVRFDRAGGDSCASGASTWPRLKRTGARLAAVYVREVQVMSLQMCCESTRRCRDSMVEHESARIFVKMKYFDATWLA